MAIDKVRFLQKRYVLPVTLIYCVACKVSQPQVHIDWKIQWDTLLQSLFLFLNKFMSQNVLLSEVTDLLVSI